MSTFPAPPPPFLPTVAVAVAVATNTRSSSLSSIIIVIIVMASAIIVSASIYLLIRSLSRRFHRSFPAADDVISSRNTNTNIDHKSSELLNSLPLFTFGSLTGNVASGDCAVCLSKFENEDGLLLLPLCCHAFHAECIEAWLVSNQTCPLCRSSVNPTEAEIMSKIQSDNGNGNGNGNSFRIEMGSISRRRGQFDSSQRSYSIGSFDYIVVDDHYEISVGSIHQRGVSECSKPTPDPPGESVAADVAAAAPRNWLRDYVRSISSRTMSFRGSGRFFAGSSRRNEVVFPVDYDLEENRAGEEISELFRWLSGV